MRDGDGSEISVTVYADENNRVLELELIKWAEAPISRPDWTTFKVTY